MFRQVVAYCCLLSYGLLSVAGSGLHLLPGHDHFHAHADHAGSACSSHGHAHAAGKGHERRGGRCQRPNVEEAHAGCGGKHEHAASPASPVKLPKHGFTAADDGSHDCAVCAFVSSLRTAQHTLFAAELRGEHSVPLALSDSLFQGRSCIDANARAPPRV
ncbi:MAG: hypothetical protein WD030_02475 [Pirellulales bacterium]